MNNFFIDIMGAPEINWGTSPITVRTKIKATKYGYTVDASVEDKTFTDVTSPQLLTEEEIKNKGFDLYAGGEVYECFSLVEIPLNKDPETYRTIIFNSREYEIIKCSPFGVNHGTPNFDGYYDIYFGRRSTTQGGLDHAQ